MNRERYSLQKEEVALNIQEITTDTTTVGSIIDTRGFDALTFIIQAGTLSDGTYTPLIQEGDNASLTDAANVADADLTITEAEAAVDASNEITKIGYKGTKRYVRLSIVSTSTASGGYIGAISVKDHPSDAPVA